MLSELHCHVGRSAARAPPLQRSTSKDPVPDIHISPNPRLAQSYILQPPPTHFAAAVLRVLWCTITGDSVIGGELSQCHNEIVVMCKKVKWLLVKPTN